MNKTWYETILGPYTGRFATEAEAIADAKRFEGAIVERVETSMPGRQVRTVVYEPPTRYRLCSTNRQSYVEVCSASLERAIEAAQFLASIGYAVRVRDWRGGPDLFAAGPEPLAAFRGEQP